MYIIIFYGDYMKTEQLLDLLDTYSQAMLIPVIAFRNDQLIFNSEAGTAVSLFLISICRTFLKSGKDYVYVDGLLMIFKVVCDDGTDIVLGPVSTGAASRDAYAHALLAMHSIHPAKETALLTDHFNRMRGVTLSRMEKCADAISLSLNGSHHAAQITAAAPSSETLADHMTENYEVAWGKHNIDQVSYMQNLIRNGRVDEMEEYFRTESTAPYGNLAEDELRHQKNSMMVHIYIMRTAARDGGLDEDLCIRLSEFYSRQCENARTARELRELSWKIRLDFCRRVRELRRSETDSHTINKAILYIHEHRMEKLDAEVIADATGVTAPYLCSEFKRKTGKSIVSYIADEKISAAKELLEHSDHSLLEISEYLSFSSQSYFQTVFRKHEGITPGEYRKRYR